MWKDQPSRPELFSDQEFDRLSYMVSILTEDVPVAKRAILQLETRSKKRSERAIFEMRDALDHLSSGLQDGTSHADARRHFSECLVHMRRAIVEPLEWCAERKLLDLETIVMGKGFLNRILGIEEDCQMKGTDFLENMKEIADEIVKGRLSKSTSLCCDHMHMACKLTDGALGEMRPKQKNARVFSVAVFIIGVILSTLLSFL